MLIFAGVESVLEETFKKKIQNTQQKQCVLLIDEVNIRPSVSYSGGVLSGMAKNEPDSKATSMMCIMMRCLHGGPSLMISVTPVHSLTAQYQYDRVVEMAGVVERSGGVVIGSITDNHKVNQAYCKLFTQKDKATFEAKHPLDDQRPWYLLYDSVHLLKCIRNNWISEKCKKMSLDKIVVGDFADVISLYKDEENSILKQTPLTRSSVFPSRLQLQNVKHVLCVFNEKVFYFSF